jgi:hypothetical protein
MIFCSWWQHQGYWNYRLILLMTNLMFDEAFCDIFFAVLICLLYTAAHLFLMDGCMHVSFVNLMDGLSITSIFDFLACVLST